MARPIIGGLDHFWACLTVDEKDNELLKSCNISKTHGRVSESSDGGIKYILMDAEGGLDRLYGGFFNDWIHGGQWCRTYQFLSKVLKCVRKGKMELVPVFNGAFEGDRICEWFAMQLEIANRSDRIVQIVGRRGIPPPKAFWIPPIAVESSLKMIFSSLRAPVIVSLDDHIREVINALQSEPPKVPPMPPQGPTALGLDPSVLTAAAFLPCSYEGLFAESPVYLALSAKQLPHFWSAHSLKLSVKQNLEGKEVFLDGILKNYNIPKSHFFIFLTLLGNNLLTDEDLAAYYQQKLNAKKNKDGVYEWPQLLKELASQVRELPESLLEKPSEVGSRLFADLPSDMSTSLATKFVQQLNYYKDLVTPLKNKTSDDKLHDNSCAPTILDDDTGSSTVPSIKRFAALGVSHSQLPNVIASLSESFKPAIVKVEDSVIAVAKDRHIRGHMHPWVMHLLLHGEIKLSTCIEPHACVQGVNASLIVPVEDVPPLIVHLFRPVRQNAYAVLFDITQKKSESSSTTESKDEKNDNSEKKEPDAPLVGTKTVQIREWFIERANGTPTPAVDLVPSVPLPNFSNPPVSKLWLSRDSGDWLLRLRTFLACFKSDAPMLSSTQYIQPHHIVPCVVLRYLLSQNVGILLPHEFDALIAQAVSPALQNPDYIADMELVSISARGIHLSSIFMRGVDHAMFVNDVCGQPIQTEYVAPWLYFDGKLFQTKLSMASQGATPRDLCEGSHEQLYLFSNLRQAILDNLQPHFARYRLSPQSGYLSVAPLSVPSSSEILVMSGNRGGPAVATTSAHHIRPHDQPAHISSHKGGQLEVGGMVVGHWGGYRGASVPAHHHHQNPYAGYGPVYQYGYGPSQWGGPPVYGTPVYSGFPGRFAESAGAKRGGKNGPGKRGGFASAVTGMGRGRGINIGNNNNNPKNKGKKGPGAGRGGSVIEKGDTDPAVEDAVEAKPESTNSSAQQEE